MKIPESKGHMLYACIQHMTLGPAKHEEVARIGRILNVFRILRALCA